MASGKKNKKIVKKIKLNPKGILGSVVKRNKKQDEQLKKIFEK